jgi:DNA polymerase III delta prime subunit
MEELKNASWVEKYRPKHVKDIIGQHTQKILKYLENPLAVPNFIFYSRDGGTGKTSIMRAIVNDLGCDKLMLNASADRSIDNVRGQIKNFLQGQSSKKNIKRCVMMDEAEKLSHDAMDALKNMIEEYSNNAFFIFTTNKINKINSPMRSRFVCYDFGIINKIEIKNYLQNICEKENLKYNEDGLNKLININCPSIRKMISIMQDLKTQGLELSSEFIVNPDDKFKYLFSLIQNKKYIELKKIILEKGINVEDFVDWIYRFCLRGELPLKQEIMIIQYCAVFDKDIKFGASSEIQFFSLIINLMKVFKAE